MNNNPIRPLTRCHKPVFSLLHTCKEFRSRDFKKKTDRSKKKTIRSIRVSQKVFHSNIANGAIYFVNTLAILAGCTTSCEVSYTWDERNKSKRFSPFRRVTGTGAWA